MRILRAIGHRRMPWKNGGGETAEIAISPPGAGLDTFDWRLSMAVVAADGPFSTFTGVDRTLAVLDGSGLKLTFPDGDARLLTRTSPPLPFPADAPVDSMLLGRGITDLNVMTRRDRFHHTVERIEMVGTLTRRVRAPVFAVVCADGELGCDVNGHPAAWLGPRDCGLLEAPGADLTLTATRPGAVLLVAIYRTAATPG
jgi:uncharacterized protein